MMLLQQIRYEARLYFRDSAFVMPLVMVAVFLCVFYSIRPLDIMSGYLMSGIVCFFIMIWIGMTKAQKENPVMEQILLLKIGNSLKYYIGKSIFMIIIVMIVDALCVLFPVGSVIINGPLMFTRPMEVSDVINAALLTAGCGMSGAALGGMFHPRIIYNRKLATVLTASIAILSISELGMVDELPAALAVLWVVPPVMLPYKLFVRHEFFNIGDSLIAFGALCAYALVYTVIRIILCNRRKF